MLLHVLKIPEIGVSYEYSSPKWALRAASTALDGEGIRAEVHYELERYGRRVIMQLKYDVQGYTICSRCNQRILVSMTGEESLAFDEDPGSGQQPKSEKDLNRISHEDEIEMEDLDIGWYQNGKLSLEDALCEAIVLGMPMRIYCALPIVKSEQGDCQSFDQEIPKTSKNLFANFLKIE
ncbi:MAG: hypothetical protein VX278_14695 [Myxococcota bacterium]|nr:hypothetical protein [Myxococcota bacterium]